MLLKDNVEQIVKKVQKVILNTKISVKLIAFYILTGLLLLLAISTVLNYKMKQVITNEIGNSYEQVVKQYVANINYKIDIYQTLMANISSNRTIGDLLSKKEEQVSFNSYDVGKKISNEINSLLGARNIGDIYNSVLYVFDKDSTVFGTRVCNMSQAKNDPWFDKLYTNGVLNNYFIYTSVRENTEVISFAKPIVNVGGIKYGEKLGIIKLDVIAASFYDFKGDSRSSINKNIVIMDSKDNFIFRGDRNGLSPADEENIRKIVSDGTSKANIKVGNKQMILVNSNIPKYEWKAVFLFNFDEIDKKVKDVRFTIIMLTTASTLLLVCLITLFSKRFTRRVYRLIGKMEKIEEGNIEITEIIEGNDEIGIVDKHFNMMVERIQHLINDDYIQKLEKREAELNALQFQINPHFLYNTLESINSMAAIKGCYEICEVSQKLGEMFRYSINISRSEFVLLDKELNHIENYIYIQKLRFSNRFEVFYNISEEAGKCRILKFILQPIIENAIVHGFDNREGMGCIEIAAGVDNGHLTIRIEDDGNGMNEEQVKELNEYIEKKEDNIFQGYKKSIGIRNVNMRIKLAYGDNYGISIKSRENEGTQVVLTLPDFGVNGET